MSIRKNPDIGGAKTGDLKGIYSLDIYYNQTNYELAYRVLELENGDIVVIIMAGTAIFQKDRCVSPCEIVLTPELHHQ